MLIDPSGNPVYPMDYMPLDEGNTWFYRLDVTDEGGSVNLRQISCEVGGIQQVRGVTTTRVIRKGLSKESLLYTVDKDAFLEYAYVISPILNKKGRLVKRSIEYFFDPPEVHFTRWDEFGKHYSQPFIFSTKLEGKTTSVRAEIRRVVLGFRPIIVPAGRFPQALCIALTIFIPNDRVWYFTQSLVKGIGQVLFSGVTFSMKDKVNLMQSSFERQLLHANVRGRKYGVKTASI